VYALIKHLPSLVMVSVSLSKGSFHRRAWSESKWTVILRYLTISTKNVSYAIEHVAICLSFSKTVLGASCAQRRETLDFISSEPAAETHWLQDSGSHIAALIMRCESTRLKKIRQRLVQVYSTAAYNVWMKRCDFCVLTICQVVQKQ